jgi:hypothetical protein
MSGRETATSGAERSASVMRVFGAATLLATCPVVAAAQTEYYNLDSNRPLRVEDALPTERRSLDVQFAPFRVDALGAGARRWRADPKLSFGVASLTEVELRVPVLFVQSGGTGAGQTSTLGLTSIGVGAMRALNTETATWHAVAVSAEVLMPVGLLAPPRSSYAVKGLLTKTTPFARLNVNGAYGTFSVTPATALPATCRFLPPGSPGCNGRPTVPDVPCSRVPPTSATRALAGPMSVEGAAGAASSTACLTATRTAASAASRSLGSRWFAGASVDHAFALSSTLVGADVFAERFIGLSRLVDWTAEIGMRHQWSPRVVLDAGISRHFAGALQSTGMTIGATYAVAVGRR